MALTDQQRRDRLRQILQEDVFVEVCVSLEQDLIAQWKGAQTTDSREAAWHEWHGLCRILKRFKGLINQGDLAESRGNP